MVVERLSSPDQGPSRLWYVAAFGVFIAGFALMAAFLIPRLSTLTDGLTQIVVPGEADLQLGPGATSIFHEAESTVNGRIYTSENLSGLLVQVTGPDGSPLKLSEPSMNSRYSFASRRGYAVFEFTAPQGGTYHIRGRYRSGASEPEAVLAVGQGFFGRLVGLILGSLALAFGGAIMAAVMAVIVFRKRRRARQLLIETA